MPKGFAKKELLRTEAFVKHCDTDKLTDVCAVFAFLCYGWKSPSIIDSKSLLTRLYFFKFYLKYPEKKEGKDKCKWFWTLQ